MRGWFTFDRLSPRNPSSDLAPLGHLLPQGEKDRMPFDLIKIPPTNHRLFNLL